MSKMKKGVALKAENNMECVIENIQRIGREVGGRDSDSQRGALFRGGG